MMVKRPNPDAVVWRETKGRHAEAALVVAHAVQGDSTLCGESAKSAPWTDTGRGARCGQCMTVFQGAPLGADEIVAAVGISYRQLDLWTRRGFLHAVGDPQPGSGRRRSWPMEEVAVAQVMHVLVNIPDGGLTPEAASRAARNNGQLAPGVVVVVAREDVQLAADLAEPVLSPAVVAPSVVHPVAVTTSANTVTPVEGAS